MILFFRCFVSLDEFNKVQMQILMIIKRKYQSFYQALVIELAVFGLGESVYTPAGIK